MTRKGSETPESPWGIGIGGWGARALSWHVQVCSKYTWHSSRKAHTCTNQQVEKLPEYTHTCMHVTHIYTLRENTTEAGSQQTRKWAHTCIYVVVAQLLSYVRLLATPQTAAHRASLSFTISWSLPTSIESNDSMPIESNGPTPVH